MSPKAIISNEQFISTYDLESDLIFQFDQFQRNMADPQRNDLILILLPFIRILIQQEIERKQSSIRNTLFALIEWMSNLCFIYFVFYLFILLCFGLFS
jgi:hypothetical protein